MNEKDPVSPPSLGVKKQFGLKTVRKNKLCNSFANTKQVLSLNKKF